MTPQRMCVICKKRDDKRNFIRLVKADNKIIIDKNQKINARAVYLCKSNECIDKLEKQNCYIRQFKTNIDSTLLQEIRNIINRERGA